MPIYSPRDEKILKRGYDLACAIKAERKSLHRWQHSGLINVQLNTCFSYSRPNEPRMNKPNQKKNIIEITAKMTESKTERFNAYLENT